MAIKGIIMENTENEIVETQEITSFNRKKFKENAKAQLKDRKKIPVLALLFSFLITSLIYIPYYLILASTTTGSAVPTESEITKAYGILFPLMLLIVAITSTLNIANLSLHFKIFKSSAKVTFSDFVSSFSLWLKGISATLVKSMYLYFWSMLASLPVLIISLIITSLLPKETSEQLVFTIAQIAAFVSYIPCFIILIVKNYQYSQMMNIIADNNSVSSKKALDLSSKITKGYKKDLFILDLSFIGWILLAFVTFGIALLWITPYMSLTKINAYDFLKKSYVEKLKSEQAQEEVKEETKTTEYSQEKDEE